MINTYKWVDLTNQTIEEEVEVEVEAEDLAEEVEEEVVEEEAENHLVLFKNLEFLLIAPKLS